MSSLSVLDFSDNLLEKTVYFKIIKLEESFFIWVGANPILSNMAVAMPAKYGNIPSGSVLFGGKLEQTSSALAQKLAKKYNSQVFISCSIPFEPTLSLAVERLLVQELNKSIST